jgi:hypothetical protein
MELPADVHLVRVKVGSEWRCATVDRERQVEVDAMLLRDAVASDPVDCPECAPAPTPEAGPAPASASTSARAVQAAAVSIQGRQVLVVLVPLDVVRSPGEADMLIADLRPRFGNVALLLMGQDDDGTPHYHGNTALMELLADVPVDKMPWKAYPLK